MLAWIARARNAGLSLADVRATLPSTAGIREHGAALVRTLVALDARRCELQAALAEVDRLHAEKRAELDSLTTALPAEFHAGA